MTTVTLKAKYHPTLSYRYPRKGMPIVNDTWSRIHSDVGRHFMPLPAALRLAHRRPSAHWRLFTVASRGGHLNHVTTIMTFLSFIKFSNLYCPRTIQFSQQQRTLLRMLQTPLAVNDRDKKNIGICKCAALSCPLKLRYSGMLPHLATRVNAHAFWSILIKMHRSSQQPITGKTSQDQCSSH